MLIPLIDQMHWANGLMIEGLHSQTEAAPEVLRLAAHILTTEALWLSRLRGEDYVRNAFLEVPLQDMSAKNDAHQAAYRDIAAGDIHRRVDYQMINGTPMNSKVQDMVLHAITHGFHHRGQISAMATQAGWKFPDTSFIGYSRGK